MDLNETLNPQTDESLRHCGACVRHGDPKDLGLKMSNNSWNSYMTPLYLCIGIYVDQFSHLYTHIYAPYGALVASGNLRLQV